MPYQCIECKNKFPKGKVRGNFWIELACWVCFCFPGIIYSLWRLTGRKCPHCGSERIVVDNA